MQDLLCLDFALHVSVREHNPSEILQINNSLERRPVPFSRLATIPYTTSFTLAALRYAVAPRNAAARPLSYRSSG
jgi:hypothetical protein